MRHQPIRLVDVLIVRVLVNDTTKFSGSSPVWCLLTPNRLHEVTPHTQPPS